MQDLETFFAQNMLFVSLRGTPFSAIILSVSSVCVGLNLFFSKEIKTVRPFCNNFKRFLIFTQDEIKDLSTLSFLTSIIMACLLVFVVN